MAKKTICDVCQSEIGENDSIGMFGFVKITERILLENPINPKQEIEKVGMDLCKECAIKVEEFIKKITEEKEKRRKK